MKYGLCADSKEWEKNVAAFRIPGKPFPVVRRDVFSVSNPGLRILNVRRSCAAAWDVEHAGISAVHLIFASSR